MPHFVPTGPDGADADRAPTWVASYAGMVWRYLRLLGWDPEDAEDLAQETLLVALRKGMGDRSNRQIAAFLRRTAKYLHLQRRRDDGRRARSLGRARQAMIDRLCDASGAPDPHLDAVRACVDDLSPAAQTIVRLFYGEGRSRAEVAGAVGMRENGVKTALQRIRAALHTCIERKTS
ncbi:MAG: RNA polymerase sigma factor [Planctomycetota bacterium]